MAMTTARHEPCYDLTLFVTGASDLSAHAVADAKKLCEAHMTGNYRLSVVDVHEQPDALVRSGVLAVPALVRNGPLPARQFVGDLSSAGRVLLALGIPDGEDVPDGLG
jgi:circadian clock protein KaiB